MLEIIRYLLRHKIRTSLTVLAVAIGMFAVTAVGSLAEKLDAIIIRPAIENERGRVAVSPESWGRQMRRSWPCCGR